ncbi:tRNA (adenosine(37)-N6)-dimethylallyltransferase MiaA [Pseudoroseicyclus sp. CXY001]|uniref:tRNA (adenosine(37)-N6)-dimethylallyltransferase MiaA n=1 Tax=Pseudoroseicyclus sp. CXY001 TaxID=3242492 RepID=UPI00358DA477
MTQVDQVLEALPPERRHILIAGPTGSGKSALALGLAEALGGTVVNADALQVFAGWRILTARPDEADLARAPHTLYGHVPPDRPYSVGAWLRDIAPLLASGERLIVTGGTGLYFTALTEGLAEIPPTPPEVRAAADEMPLSALVAGLDAASRAALDLANRARVQRAWEVLTATGTGIRAWQDETPPPLLHLDQTAAFVLEAPPPWLNPRLARRFAQMMEAGLFEEGRAMAPGFSPAHPASKAIGARELVAHVEGRLSEAALREAVLTLSRQYAKRQRSWFRARMRGWTWLSQG